MIKLSVLCMGGRHCETCRDRDGGREWRRGLSVAYELPANAPDFECIAREPRPWGWRWTPDQPARGLGDVVAKMTHAVGIEPCGGCAERQEWLNKVLPFGGGTGSQVDQTRTLTTPPRDT